MPGESQNGSANGSANKSQKPKDEEMEALLDNEDNKT